MLFTTANTKLGSVSVDVLFCNYDKVTPLCDLTPSTDKTYEKKSCKVFPLLFFTFIFTPTIIRFNQA